MARKKEFQLNRFISLEEINFSRQNQITAFNCLINQGIFPSNMHLLHIKKLEINTRPLPYYQAYWSLVSIFARGPLGPRACIQCRANLPGDMATATF